MQPQIPLRGLIAARFVQALTAAKCDPIAAIAYAQGRRWHDTPAVVTALKAVAVNPLDTDTDSSLIGDAGRDVAELVRPLTIIGRLPGLRRVPFDTRLLDLTAYSEAGWVGEGNPLPITRASFTGERLAVRKVGASLVVTEELAKLSNPAAEGELTQDLARAPALEMDATFIDVNNAGSGIKPASITHGVTPRVSSGGTLADIDADFAALLSELDDAGSTLEFAAWVMRPRSAIHLSKLRGSGGALAYPEVTARGGRLFGLPVITSNAVPMQSTSGDPSQITLIDGSRVTVADDGESEINVSREATVQLNDAPETGAMEQVSLWQLNLVGVRVVRIVNWKARTGQAAAVLSEVEF